MFPLILLLVLCCAPASAVGVGEADDALLAVPQFSALPNGAVQQADREP